jgi:enoyl-CoA hydratase/carnithine racemase
VSAGEIAERTDAALLDVDQGVALITLNRPHRLNAWNAELGERFFAAVEAAADREDVRAIVVTGAGRGFCSGADFSVLGDLGDGTVQFEAPPTPFSALRAVPKPVIAAVNGPCAGLGLLVALMCDLRFATPETKLMTGFGARGLVAEQGLAWLLPRLVGASRALDLLFSARVVLGEEAHAIGLVDRLHPHDALLERSLDYARALAERSSPVSMAVMKWQVQRGLETGLEQAVAEADVLTRHSLVGRDFCEVGTRLVPGEAREFAPLPRGRLGDAPPVDLIPPPR